LENPLFFGTRIAEDSGVDATHLHCEACKRVRPIRFEPLLAGEPSLGTQVRCAHCRRLAFTLLRPARFYCEVCDNVEQAGLERVNGDSAQALAVLMVCGGCFDAKATLYAAAKASPFSGAAAPPLPEPPAGRARRE